MSAFRFNGTSSDPFVFDEAYYVPPTYPPASELSSSGLSHLRPGSASFNSVGIPHYSDDSLSRYVSFGCNIPTSLSALADPPKSIIVCLCPSILFSPPYRYCNSALPPKMISDRHFIQIVSFMGPTDINTRPRRIGCGPLARTKLIPGVTSSLTAWRAQHLTLLGLN